MKVNGIFHSEFCSLWSSQWRSTQGISLSGMRGIRQGGKAACAVGANLYSSQMGRSKPERAMARQINAADSLMVTVSVARREERVAPLNGAIKTKR